MKALIDFDTAPVFGIPISDGSGVREGMLIEGPQAWGEFSPPTDADDRVTERWLTAAMEGGTVGWPDAVRGRIAIAVAVPGVEPDRARRIVVDSGCRTADVTVATASGSPAADLARIEAVRDALGPGGSIRMHLEDVRDVDDVVRLVGAAGELEFVVAPWRTREELADVRRRVHVPVAATAELADAADIAILRSGPLGGVRRALRLAERLERPCVVASSDETSIGLAAGLALAGSLPDLPFACGLGTIAQLSGDLVTERRSLRPVAGYLPVAPMAAEPAAELVARYALTDRARIAWWRGRLEVVVGNPRGGTLDQA